MKILHLSNDFAGTKVHANLYSKLDALGVRQTIYTTVTSEELIGRNKFDGQYADFLYAPIRKKIDSYFFRWKTRKSVKYITTHLDLSEYDLIHATTLFSDGAVGLEFHKKYGIPLVVAVRDCDISGFLKKAPHTWNIGMEVLKESSFVVFISKALKERFLKHPAISLIRKQIEQKMIVCPNGIDDYWLNNQTKQRTPIKPNFCYIGRMERIKNVPAVMKAVLSLKEKIPEIHFDIVGAGGRDEARIKNLSAQHPETIQYYGPIYDKNELRNIFLRNNVFIMASHHETFGLVYIEALTQGLNVIFTKNEGIDGMFPSSIGIAVNSHNEKEIAEAMERICSGVDDFVLPSIDFSIFRWNHIGEFYLSLYKKALQI